VGSARFSGFRLRTRFALLRQTPYQSLCALLLFSVLANFKKNRLAAVAVAGRVSNRFRSAALPATHASWTLPPESGKRIRPVDK
jgi:hypothetical protein